MKLTDARNMYLADMLSEGRISPGGSERAYHDVLTWHAEDCGNRDPRTIGREDVKRTLRRWPNANTQRNRRSILVSFYRWTVEEGYRKDNPAEQTRRPKKQPTNTYRLNGLECNALILAAHPGMETWAISLGLYAGLRRNELRHLRGLHFARHELLWVSPDIGKGGKERWVPIPLALRPVVEDIRATVGHEEFVLCGTHDGITPHGRRRQEFRDKPMSQTKLYDLVVEVAVRAGIPAHVHPHLLRHAYGDHMTRYAGLRVAQEAMGHADPSTTELYTGRMTPDELSMVITDFTFTATPSPRTAETQQYRYGDSNPGNHGAGVAVHGDEYPEEN